VGKRKRERRRDGSEQKAVSRSRAVGYPRVLGEGKEGPG